MSGRQFLRLAWLTAALAPVVLFGIVTYFWVESNVPRWVYWQCRLVFLILGEIAYVVVVVIAVPGTFLTGAALIRSRRQRKQAFAIARWFLLCTSVVLALALAEGAGALWLCWSRAAPVLPAGGFGETNHTDPATRVTLPRSELKLPNEFPDPPGDRVIDIVVVGESSAEGHPYQEWLSVGHIVKWQLNEIIPDRPVRLDVIARGGEVLEQQQERLATLQRRPDLLIVYCGHNEFQARFQGMRDLRHYCDEQQPNLREVLVNRLERLSPVCGLIRYASEKCRIGIPPSDESPRRLVDVPSFTTGEYDALRDDFARRLEAISSYAEQIGALLVLVVPPANDASFEPNRSYLPAGTTRAERVAFEHEFLAIRRRESREPRDCIEHYRKLVGRQPGFAEAHYRLAQLLSSAGDWNEAYSHFIAARDLDGYPTRAPSDFQQAYRDVARRHGGILIDGQSLFHTIGPHGMLDHSLFHDAMHPSLRGYIALAQAILEALQGTRAFGWPRDIPAPTIEPAHCAVHFGVGRKTWRHVSLWAIGFNDLMAPLRYDPIERHVWRFFISRPWRELTLGLPPNHSAFQTWEFRPRFRLCRVRLSMRQSSRKSLTHDQVAGLLLPSGSFLVVPGLAALLETPSRTRARHRPSNGATHTPGMIDNEWPWSKRASELQDRLILNALEWLGAGEKPPRPAGQLLDTSCKRTLCLSGE